VHGRWDVRVNTLQPQKHTWDARNRTMDWKSPPLVDVSHQPRCTFTDDNNRRCTLALKNWLGKVLSIRTAARSAATIDHASILLRMAGGALLRAKDLPACRCVAAFSLPIAARSGSLQDTLKTT
jgi:hypothetical protein